MNRLGAALGSTFAKSLARAIDKTLPPDARRPGDDLGAATARKLGIPVIDRSGKPEPDKRRPNRAERRAARSGATIRVMRGGNYEPRTSPRGAYRGQNPGFRTSTVDRITNRLNGLDNLAAIEASIARHPAGKAA